MRGYNMKQKNESIKDLGATILNDMGISEPTRKTRLMICRECGEPIDQLYKAEYLCSECYVQVSRERGARFREKMQELFNGLYLYMILDLKGNIIYIGSTTNIYIRHSKHYSYCYDTTFSTWIMDNNLKNTDYVMKVLDLSFYRDSLNTTTNDDDNDLLLLEHYNIAGANVDFDIINKKMLEFDFSHEHIERINYLHKLIDMSEWVEYNEFVRKKNKLSECESDNLSTAH